MYSVSRLIPERVSVGPGVAPAGQRGGCGVAVLRRRAVQFVDAELPTLDGERPEQVALIEARDDLGPDITLRRAGRRLGVTAAVRERSLLSASNASPTGWQGAGMGSGGVMISAPSSSTQALSHWALGRCRRRHKRPETWASNGTRRRPYL